LEVTYEKFTRFAVLSGIAASENSKHDAQLSQRDRVAGCVIGEKTQNKGYCEVQGHSRSSR